MTSTSTDAEPIIAAAVIVHYGRLLLVRRRVKEGSLSWQFPAGGIEEDEDPTDAAVRETLEETGLVVKASKVLGERVHPHTGRTMIYVACDVVSGQATVVDDDELDSVAWADRAQLADYVPYPFYEPVQAHLNVSLA